MSSEVAIRVAGLGKCYHIYEKPRDRLLQMLFRGRRRYYREFWALRDVSFEVRRGETVGIVGRNGSGKSTLLQMICGTLSTDVGSIETDGRIAALLELGSGFNPEFTGRENVHLYTAVLGLSAQQTAERFPEIEAFADIGDFLDQPVKTYSSGMVVRLAFAVAINADPQILVVDEALSVGDELFQRKCFSRIESIRAAGATILFVSHSGGTVVEICDRALLLDAGERIAMGEPKQIVGLYQKLLYAPADRREALRAGIRADDRAARLDVSDSPATAGPAPVAVAPVPREAIELPESYDPALRPTSTIAYESHGAYIENPALSTKAGDRVNNLNRGKTYRYTYRVRFDRAASNVRFGMMCKTTSGVELGGGVSAPSVRSSLPYVTAGSVYRVEFDFVCRLAPGVYFMNAGVVGDLDGSETYLHRLVDIAMFRVVAESDCSITGIVDFGCSATVEREGADGR